MQLQPPHGQGNSKRLLEGQVGVEVSHWRAPGGRGCDQSPRPLGPAQVTYFGWMLGSSSWKPELNGRQCRGCSAKEQAMLGCKALKAWFTAGSPTCSHFAAEKTEAQREQVTLEKLDCVPPTLHSLQTP